MRRGFLVGSIILLLAGLWPTEGAAWIRGYKMWTYGCTTTRSGIVGANPARVWVQLINLGPQTVMIGGSMGNHVDAGAMNGWPLHAASQMHQAHALTLQGGGQIECIVLSTTLPATAHVGVIEALE